MADDPRPALTAHEVRNRESWDAYSDEYQDRHGEQLAASGGLAWGTYQIPEATLRVLDDVVGKDVLELGCGAAQWSIALARLGARPVGLDLSDRQLEHARRLMAEAGVEFPLVSASAEAVPLPDASFDIVFCDHGADELCRSVPDRARSRPVAPVRRPVRVQPPLADPDDLLAARGGRGRRAARARL